MTTTSPSTGKFGKKSAFVFVVLILLPIYLTFYALGDLGRGMAACVAAIGIGGTVLAYSDKWSRAWFWISITVLILLHSILVVVIPWEERGPGPALAGQAIIDLLICFGVIAATEKIVKRVHP